MTFENKYIRAAIPALLIHSCIGSVYCWSLIKNEVAAEIGCGVSSIEMAFSLAIFFLGMSAAFGGRFVEQNVKVSSLLSLVFFASGLLLSVLSIHMHSPIGFMLSYGCIMGIGLGIGYLSPVKTLMLWFSEHKGLATGIAISGFGLSKAIFSPYIEWCNEAFGVSNTLVSIASISTMAMLLASILIHKPKAWKEEKTPFNIKEYFRIISNETYLKIWLVFYLNITCGLALISFEKGICASIGITAVGLIASLTAFFNTIGRFGYATISDWFKRKEHIYTIIFASCLLMTTVCGYAYYIPCVIVMLCVINAGYGGGFSTLPTLLQSKFGMDKISTIHGLALSAWAWAGLSGNQLSDLIVNKWGEPYEKLILVLSVFYGISMFVTLSIKKEET